VIWARRKSGWKKQQDHHATAVSGATREKSAETGEHSNETSEYGRDDDVEMANMQE